MTASDISNTIKNTLGIPVVEYGIIPDFDCAMLDMYREDPGTSGDGHVETWVKSAQIDLYYTKRSDRDTASDALKEAFKSQRMAVVSVEKTYDTSTRRYRATYQLEII